MIQKRAIRVITNSKYYAHTTPLFKRMFLLKLPNMYDYQVLNLHYKIENNLAPQFYSNFCIHNWNVHDHNTRGRNNLRPTGRKSDWLRHYLPNLVLTTPTNILDLIHSSETIKPYKRQIKVHYINQYNPNCTRDVCLPCGRGQFR